MENKDKLKIFPNTVLESGYGLVGKIVMKDRRIKAGSKALYAYLCTHARFQDGSYDSAYPSRAVICEDLGITKDTYYRYLNPLIELGYISVQKHLSERHVFQHNTFIIEIVPCPKNKDMDNDGINEPCPKKEDMEDTTVNYPCPEKKDTAEPCPDNRDKEKPDTENVDTNNNNTNNNNYINNTTTYKHRVSELNEQARRIVVQFAIPEITILRFMENYKVETVEKNLLLMSVVSEKKRINNPPGWLHAALRDGYADNVEAYHKQQEDIRREQHIQNEKIQQAMQKQITQEMIDKLANSKTIEKYGSGYDAAKNFLASLKGDLANA